MTSVLKARMIRPEFWTDERVISLSAPGRLLFIACWQLADDHGRFEWEPGRIKWQVFPADAFDVEAMGAELDAIGLIQIYTGDGRRFVSIPNFSKHQKLHKGRDSNFPIPPQIGPDRPKPAQTGPKPNLTKPNLREPKEEEDPPTPRKRGNAPANPSALEVLAYLNEKRGGRGFGEPGPHITARIAEGVLVDDLKLIIDWFKADTDARPDARKYFDNVTPFRAGNFQRYLNQADDWDKAGRVMKRDLPRGVYISPNANLPNGNALKENPTDDDVVF